MISPRNRGGDDEQPFSLNSDRYESEGGGSSLSGTTSSQLQGTAASCRPGRSTALGENCGTKDLKKAADHCFKRAKREKIASPSVLNADVETESRLSASRAHLIQYTHSLISTRTFFSSNQYLKPK